MRETSIPLSVPKIAIVTDSTSDLDSDMTKEFGIEILPLHVVYKDREYLDGVSISPNEVYDNMDIEVPTTSLPSPAEISNLFDRLREEKFTHILTMHISSGLSGTYETVCQVAKDYKEMEIEVLDSKALSMGLGFPVLQAARELRKSIDFQAVLKVAKKVSEQTKLYFVLSTLEYLKRGGRIGYVSGTIGELLNIKPIISINSEGKYITYSKVRGRDQSLKKLYDILIESIQDGQYNVAIVHGGAEQEARKLWQNAKELPNIKELLFNQISPVMGVHTGPGLVGVIISPVLTAQS
ncbi:MULTISPECIES: DegV family protein [Desulfosporosinus]|uniref:DegV family protein n=1 Tax=Desulfosporosinus nitroreducens TaxID=2018668 RepID=A0ABT8QMS2_9FIRM|nr:MULTISPECIES: DegV family protein [Desulfosporosinus]MCO1600314.1 DegV family protein [Desulfosporosinus nitroreducens]MCO5386696.1 DegV family protein [Desulfosporosinus sp.]MDA8222754.1 DegV family protein [Desulfitobacterium hafniense]MDO0821403.1 DegV family protein [Desulfosporosinus nitroreducens]